MSSPVFLRGDNTREFTFECTLDKMGAPSREQAADNDRLRQENDQLRQENAQLVEENKKLRQLIPVGVNEFNKLREKVAQLELSIGPEHTSSILRQATDLASEATEKRVQDAIEKQLGAAMKAHESHIHTAVEGRFKTSMGAQERRIQTAFIDIREDAKKELENHADDAKEELRWFIVNELQDAKEDFEKHAEATIGEICQKQVDKAVKVYEQKVKERALRVFQLIDEA